jgi:O-methyltransferase
MLSKVARLFGNARLNKMDSNSIVAKASRFVACEMVDGDYLEFGVFQGSSFVKSYRWLERNFRSRINLSVGGENQLEGQIRRRAIWNSMRFFAFDSFEGLPELSGEDFLSHDFAAGQYACDVESFLKNVSSGGVPLKKTFAVKGFFFR